MKNIIISSLALWLLVFFIGCTTNIVEETQIKSFDECVAAGFPVMESYPEQCSDGTNTFTREINESKNLILDSYGNKVPESCQSWFDGCNNCNVFEDGSLACTKIYCSSESLGEAKCNK